MQTSLERRERRRRQGTQRHKGGSGAGRAISIILPLLLLGTLAVTGLVSLVGVLDAYAYYSRDLEDPRALLENISYNQQTVLYDRTGKTELARYGAENRRLLTYQDVPATILDTTTSAEDKTFWTNTGFDPRGVLSAFMDTLAGRPRGASTITQELMRVGNMLPPSESTAERKIKEIIQSIRLTDEYPGREGKEAIMTAYLNLNFYGHQSYGVAAAAQIYFGVSDLNKLTLAQAAIIAGILQAPTQDDLYANSVTQDDGTIVVPDSTAIVARRNWVLGQLKQNVHDSSIVLLGHWTDDQIDAAMKEPVVLHPATGKQNIAPQFDLQVRSQLAALLCGPDVAPDDCGRVDTGGYQVITTIDLAKQAAAEKWLKAYIIAPNQPSSTATASYLASLGITPKSDSFNYSHIMRLRGDRIHNGAIGAIDYRTGQVLAYAGSAGFYEKPVAKTFDPQFDVLGNGWRQPGSSFKPVNYSIGIEDKTMTAATMFMDVSTDFGGGYRPADADRLQRGPLRLRTALMYSLNIPAIKAAAINGVDHVLKRMGDFGITYPETVHPGVSIGIGTVEVHPIDLLSAYGAIANQGSLVPRTMILEIKDSKGNVVFPTPGSSTTPTGKRVISPQTSYVMTSILASNTDPAQNRWWGVYQLKSSAGRRPATLKTGTSDNNTDLFAGGWVAPPKDTSQPAVAGMVWTGNSDHSVGKAVLALDISAPMWHAFMMDVTAGTPIVNFPQPSGVVWKTVDGNSGMLPGPYTTYTVSEVFVAGTEPKVVDDTKIGMDVDSVTGKLWDDTCTGQRVSKGFLDLSKVDASRPSWQAADNAWIARVRKGGGSSFYANGYGAPFVPDTTNPANYCAGSPPPSVNPGPTPSPSDGQGGQPATPPPSKPTPTPKKRRAGAASARSSSVTA